MQRSFTATQLDRRANRLLRGARNVPPTSDVIRELAEICARLEDEPVVRHDNVVARLTVKRADGKRNIVEVYEDSNFHSFFHFFTQEGNRRSTKRQTRIACRNEGLIPGALGLDGISKKLERYQFQSNPINSIKLRVFKKRAYKRLLSVSSDQLGVGS